MKPVVSAGKNGEPPRLPVHGRTPLLTEKGVCVLSGAQLDPSVPARLGGAAAACFPGGKFGVACDGKPLSHAVGRIFMGAAAAKGGRVGDFGDGFLSQMHFYSSFCGLHLGVFVACAHGRVRLHFCFPGGLPLPRETQLALEQRCQSGLAARVSPAAFAEISDMTGMQAIYQSALLREAVGRLSGQAVSVGSPNERVQMAMEDALYRLGAKTGDETVFRFGADGTAVCAYRRGLGQIGQDRLLAVCCKAELDAGNDLALPEDAPCALTRLAEACGRRALRYGRFAPASQDAPARRLAADRLYLRDALFLCLRVLGVQQSTGKPLDRLLRELPAFSVRRRTVPVAFPVSEFADRFPHARRTDPFEAFALSFAGGCVRVFPGRRGNRVTLLAEAATPEAAEELCGDLEARLRRH